MAQTGGISSLATILKRLETVTSRLEDVATATTGAPLISQSSTEAVHHAMASHAPVAAADAPTPAAAPTLNQDASGSPATKGYQNDVIGGPLQEYLQKSEEVGGLVAEQARLVSALCSAQLSFLTLASQCTKPPTPQALLPLLKNTQDALQAVVAFKDEKSKSKEGRAVGNHLIAVGEGVGAWGWVAVEPTPAPFIAEMKDSAQFYTNRVLKEFKDSDPKHVAWARAFIALLDGLQKYVKQWHTTGVTWNPQGSDPSTVTNAPSSSAAPPPPPPPPPTDAPSGVPKAAASGGPSAFLAQITQGTAVTSGLKKVDKSEMTHKNPALRASGVVGQSASPTPARPAKPSNLAAKKPSKTDLDGTKWIVEYHENNSEIIIDNTEINHTVQIFGCKSSVIQIKGKVNAVNMVNCTKTSILLESLVSQLSITSSPSFTVQILGQVPTILIDTTDSGQVYLSKDCVDTTEIVTSKTSALNISVPVGDAGEFMEKPVPEQMRSIFKDGKLVTTIVEHAG